MSADAPPAGRSGARPVTIVLATIGAAVLIALLIASFAMWGERHYRDNARVESAAPGDKPVEFTLRPQGELTGTNLIMMDVAGGNQRDAAGSYSSGQTDVRNIILIDKASGASRRLLPDNSRRISASRFFPARVTRVAESAGPPVLIEGEDPAAGRLAPAYFVLDLESQDGDLLDVVVGTLADTRLDTVMSGVEGIDAVWMQSPTQIGFLVRERRGLHYRIVDVPARKVLISRKVEVG